MREKREGERGARDTSYTHSAREGDELGPPLLVEEEKIPGHIQTNP